MTDPRSRSDRLATLAWLAGTFIAVLLFGLLFVHSAHAGGCTFKDKWRGPDKVLHAQGGAAIGFIGAMNNGSIGEGVRWSALAGGLKEAIDLAGGGQCSAQDFIVTVGGGALGASLGAGVSVFKTRDGVRVVVSRSFR